MQTKDKKTDDLRKGFALFALLSFVLTVFQSGPVSAAGRVPLLDGPSIRLDFGTRFIEEWVTALPDDFQRVVVPRREGVFWEDAIGEGVWAGAAELGPLVRGEPRTEIHAFYTDDALFLRLRNGFDPANPPQAEWRPRDQWVGGEDVVEIHLRRPADRTGQGRFRPREDDRNLYHFVVNAAGAVYDARDRDASYDPDWRSLVETADETWTVRVMIPFTALDMTGPVPALEINIGRDGAAAEMLSWGPVWGGTEHRRVDLEGAPAPRPASASAGEEELEETGVLVVGSGRGLSLDWVGGKVRAQDRWVEGSVSIGSEFVGTGAEVEVSLRALGATEPVERVNISPERGVGRLAIDPRRWGMETADIEVRLISGGEVVGLARSFIEVRPLPSLPMAGFRVPLVVDVPDSPGPSGVWPLYAGVPFPAGMLWEAADWVVEDEAGHAYPTQLAASGLWARDGAIQWLRVETVADPRAELFLVYRPGTAPPVPAGAVSVRREEERVFVSSGEVEYELSGAGSPITAVRRGGRVLASAEGARGLYLVDQRGRTAVASGVGADILVESTGPVAGSVRIEGDYLTEEGEAVARHITRVEISSGEQPARVTHTLVLTRDTNEVWFREAGWELALAPGADPEVAFGVSRQEPGAYRRVTGGAKAYLVQESYYRFGTGEKRFRLVSGGQELLAGEEMGDWFLAQNDSSGLMWSCRDSARQHPKEFAVSGSLVNLVLYSPRAGEELDFRSETLVERWNLRGWYSNDRWDALSEPARAAIETDIDRVRAIPSNALGWAKTHHLMFSPSADLRAPEEVAALSAWHSRPVFALADPAWTWRSRAMGPLHPRDPERFPDAERLVDGALDFFASRVPLFGEWGFVDYWAGPHLNHSGTYPQARRWRLTYTLRPDSWRVFARSGRREAYDFATATNRSWGDNYLASWGDDARTKGLYTSATGADRRYGAPSLPFYWGLNTVANVSSSTNIDQFLWDYHLTGYRRAADQVRDFAAGLKRQLTPQALERDWRILMTFRTLMQCYGFTWDEDLRQLASEAANAFEDPAGAIGLTKERAFRSSTYKTPVDIRALFDAWRITGETRYYRTARILSEYLWESFLGSAPISYTNPQGIVGHFLWEETRDPAIAQSLLMQMGWMASQYDADAAGHGISLGAHAATPIFEGVPAMQDVVVRTGADRVPVASWAAVRDFESPVGFLFHKGDQETVRVALKTSGAAGGTRIRPVNPPTTFDLGVLSTVQKHSGFASFEAPRDLDEMALRITPGSSGTHYGTAGGNIPMVLHAPGYWVPWPPQEPPVRWYFRVPEDAVSPAVFFEGSARLFSPGGELWKETAGLDGWLDLPAGEPGLWSFEPSEPRLVRVRNLPPLFAAGNPDSWFDPGIEWTPEEEKTPFDPPGETGFTDGFSGRTGEQALFISSSGSFSVEGGEPRPGEGEGTEFLPFLEGTIEFWMRPAWSFHEVPKRRRHPSQRILVMSTDQNPWTLTYTMDYSRDELGVHNLHAHAFAEDGTRRRTFQSWRRFTLFEAGEWVHIALVWGPRVIPTARGPRETLSTVVYVNGRAGSRHSTDSTTLDMRPADMPKSLRFPGLGAAIDHLRISDVRRYQSDFDPPVSPPEVDGHTRAYFSFDGTIEGVSGDGRTITGTIAP